MLYDVKLSIQATTTIRVEARNLYDAVQMAEAEFMRDPQSRPIEDYGVKPISVRHVPSAPCQNYVATFIPAIQEN